MGTVPFWRSDSNCCFSVYVAIPSSGIGIACARLCADVAFSRTEATAVSIVAAASARISPAVSLLSSRLKGFNAGLTPAWRPVISIPLVGLS